MMQSAVLLRYTSRNITRHIGRARTGISRKGYRINDSFLNAISENIPRIVDEGYKCVISLINGMADAIRNNNGERIKAVDNLMDAIIQAITQWLVKRSEEHTSELQSRI